MGNENKRSDERLTYINHPHFVKKATTEIRVYGLSISPVDENYLDWIEQHTPLDCKWEFSWHTDKDKERIEKFVLEHWRIRDRCTTIQLQEVVNK